MGKPSKKKFDGFWPMGVAEPPPWAIGVVNLYGQTLKFLAEPLPWPMGVVQPLPWPMGVVQPPLMAKGPSFFFLPWGWGVVRPPQTGQGGDYYFIIFNYFLNFIIFEDFYFIIFFI
jgi:hypothetical protein